MAKARTTKAGKEPATKQSRAKATPTPSKAAADATEGRKVVKNAAPKAKQAGTKSDNSKKRELISTAIKKKALLNALRESLGVVTAACEALGFRRQLHYEWLAEDPEYAREVARMDDIALDTIESALHKRIKEGSDAAIIFALKTKGKKRGYVERTEHIVETTENLAARISYEQAQNLLANAGLEPPKKSDALTADE